ncbi:MAG: peptide chain release factor N(5)-glutamine methyltransferase [Candidatus Magasanikbacteria bacterium]
MKSIKELRSKFLQLLPSPESDSLLQLSCNKEKAFILAHPEYKLSIRELIIFFYYLFEIKHGIPIAYLAGKKEFYGLNFKINKHTLIPRPDTELMVEEVLADVNSSQLQISDTTLIDVGTGSGCIPISVLKNLKQFPKETLAIDISNRALKVAKENAKQNGVSIKFIHGNLLTPILNYSLNTNIVLTANLPYLTIEQFINEPSIQHEPKSALVSSDNGLALYKKLMEQIKILNKTVTVFLEIDPNQTEKIKTIIIALFPQAKIKIKTDLAGRDRLVILKIN